MTGDPLIIDCDPGIDDALAIFLALGSPELDLVGVTTVAGNRPLDQVTRNALALLAIAGRSDVPVHAGCARGLLPRNIRNAFAHGEDGLGGLPHPEGIAEPVGHAVDYLVETIMAAEPGTVTLAAIGPLTNVATAFTREPRLAERLKRLVVMGGAVGVPGNITPTAEFNFMHDPAAAHIVLSSGAAIDLFGLNLTRQVRVTAGFVDGIAASGTRTSTAVAAMTRAYVTKDSAMHDPCVVAKLIAPQLFGGTMARVIVDYRPGPTDGTSLLDPTDTDERLFVNVVETVDSDGVRALLTERIARLP
ncbi:nucleoside hydrolase [Acuticoccus mangrovi]|uniref:Nucleoside hydrolase n=1 Tax=Acuticoccus mangrovi TaxID=2796142 RepID=A0A934MDH6_9HYPH|nr:nucleoside hydrolase [Acuticoccus mangrovi]MBJ3776367.1 nucleoside hydrolase [Acuticoccus mangrovi]